MTKLLNCPFCGGEAFTYCMHDWWVSHDCYALGRNVSTKLCKTEAEAIEAWNTRAERTCNIVYDSGIAHCDTCGAGTYTGSNFDYWHYCPNCGARVVDE